MPLKLGVPEISAPQFHLNQELISGTPCSSVIRVQPPITENVLITEQFPIFTSFISRIEQFFVSVDVQTGGLQMFFEHQK
jgi:hypothetical protein